MPYTDPTTWPAPPPPFSTGWEGTSGLLPDPGLDQLLALVLQSVGPSLLGGAGMVPMGVDTRNFYTRMQAQRQTIARQQLLQQASQLDQGRVLQRAKGLAALHGQAWTPETQEASRRMFEWATPVVTGAAQAMPQMLPYLEAMGYENFVMAHGITSGMRYRMDPLTGLMGSSTDTQQAAITGMQALLQSPGDLRGLTPGQASLAFEELQRRGYMHGPGTLQEVYEAQGNAGWFRAAAQKAGVNLPANLDNLSATDRESLLAQGPVQEIMRDFDSTRIVQSLKQYAGAVSAMQEIFGDAGKPMAPFNELINALEELTSGAMPQIGAAKAEQLVRATYNLAKSTGVGLDGLRFINQMTAEMTSAAGLPSAFNLPITQRALAMQAYYGAAGVAAHPEWGLGTMAETRMIEQRLGVAATQSPAANQIGMVMRLSDTLGPNAFRSGSAAAAYIEAVRGGRTVFTDPATGDAQSLLMSNRQLFEMLRSGTTMPDSLSMGELAGMFFDEHANQEYGFLYDAGGLTRRMQGSDVRMRLGRVMADAMKPGLRTAGIADEATAQALGSVATEALFGLKLGHRDTKSRNEAMVAAMQTELERRQTAQPGGAADLFLQRYAGDDAGLNQRLLLLAEEAYSRGDTLMPGLTAGKIPTMQQAMLQLGDQAINAAEQQAHYANSLADTQRAMSGLGRGGMLFRFGRAIQDVDLADDSSLKKIIAETLGFTKLAPTAAEKSALLRQFRGFREQASEAERVILDPNATPEVRAQAEAEMAKVREDVLKSTEQGSDAERLTKMMLAAEYHRQRADTNRERARLEKNPEVRRAIDRQTDQHNISLKKLTKDAADFAALHGISFSDLDPAVRAKDATETIAAKEAEMAQLEAKRTPQGFLPEGDELRLKALPGEIAEQKKILEESKRDVEADKAAAERLEEAGKDAADGAADRAAGAGEAPEAGDQATTLKISGKVSLTEDGQLVFDDVTGVISGGRNSAWAAVS